jgi:hypothetical protein
MGRDGPIKDVGSPTNLPGNIYNISGMAGRREPMQNFIEVRGRTGTKGAKNGRPKYLQQVRKVILLVVRSEGTRTELPGKIEIDLPA